MSNVKDILAVLRFCALGILLFAPVASHALPACDDHFALRLPDTALGGTAEAQVAPPPPRIHPSRYRLAAVALLDGDLRVLPQQLPR